VDDEKFIDLAHACIDGGMGEQEVREFLEMIEESDEKKDILAQNMVIDRLLETSKRRPVTAEQIMAALPRRRDTVSEVLQQIRREKKTIQVRKGRYKTRIKAGQPARERTATVLFMKTVTAVAAAFLVIGGAWWLIRQSGKVPAEDTLALVDARGEILLKRNNRSSVITGNALLYKGDEILTTAGGHAVIRYRGEGTFINLRAGSSLVISERQKAKRFFLKHGSLSAGIAAQPTGRPLVIETPLAHVTVIGTRLNLRSRTAACVLKVTEGKAAVTRKADESTVEVAAGHIVEIRGGGVPLYVRPVEKVVLGHLTDSQLADIDEALRTARAWGINTLTYEMNQDDQPAPDHLRQAIDSVHHDDIRFLARVKVEPGDGKSYDSAFSGILLERIVEFLAEYDFDGIYVAGTQHSGTDARHAAFLGALSRSVNRAEPGLDMLVGVDYITSTNEAWFLGY